MACISTLTTSGAAMLGVLVPATCLSMLLRSLPLLGVTSTLQEAMFLEEAAAVAGPVTAKVGVQNLHG